MTVVLGYDDSPGARAALEVALEVAGRWGSGLRVVYGAGASGEEAQVLRDALAEVGGRALANARERATAAGVSVEVDVVPAKPAEALLRVAEAHDATVIVVGTSGEGPFRSALVGSTPHKLLQLSSRPVLCVPASADG
ncbi:universal stress protein [Nocardioides marmoraquaticus]